MSYKYDSSVLLNVLSLQRASASIASHPAFDDFLAEFHSIAHKHKQNDRYGITLVHRHAQVKPHERLMDFGSTLQPLQMDEMAQSFHGYAVSPKSLMLHEGKWMAYEYQLGQHGEPDPVFLDKFKALVNHLDVRNIGIRYYSPSDPEELEITETGGISIRIPWDSLAEGQESYKTTFWAFPTGEPKVYRCACIDTGTEENPNHHHIDQK